MFIFFFLAIAAASSAGFPKNLFTLQALDGSVKGQYIFINRNQVSVGGDIPAEFTKSNKSADLFYVDQGHTLHLYSPGSDYQPDLSRQDPLDQGYAYLTFGNFSSGDFACQHIGGTVGSSGTFECITHPNGGVTFNIEWCNFPKQNNSLGFQPTGGYCGDGGILRLKYKIFKAL